MSFARLRPLFALLLLIGAPVMGAGDEPLGPADKLLKIERISKENLIEYHAQYQEYLKLTAETKNPDGSGIEAKHQRVLSTANTIVRNMLPELEPVGVQPDMKFEIDAGAQSIGYFWNSKELRDREDTIIVTAVKVHIATDLFSGVVNGYRTTVARMQMSRASLRDYFSSLKDFEQKMRDAASQDLVLKKNLFREDADRVKETILPGLVSELKSFGVESAADFRVLRHTGNREITVVFVPKNGDYSMVTVKLKAFPSTGELTGFGFDVELESRPAVGNSSIETNK
jgi:hypothetical protein